MSPEFKKYVLNFFYVVLFVGIYFTAWRPARGWMAYNISYPLAETVNISEEHNWVLTPGTSVGYYISKGSLDANAKSYSMKVLGGMFFLLPSIFFLALFGDWKSVGLLWIAHMLLWLMTLFFLVVGLSLWAPFINMIDIVTKYLVPGLSMGLVIYIWIKRKGGWV